MLDFHWRLINYNELYWQVGILLLHLIVHHLVFRKHCSFLLFCLELIKLINKLTNLIQNKYTVVHFLYSIPSSFFFSWRITNLMLSFKGLLLLFVLRCLCFSLVWFSFEPPSNILPARNTKRIRLIAAFKEIFA